MDDYGDVFECVEQQHVKGKLPFIVLECVKLPRGTSVTRSGCVQSSNKNSRGKFHDELAVVLDFD
jgi:hypothetical protein